MVMDVAALGALVAVVDAGSISAAARRLSVTQPAVSQKLASLEAALGQQLLVRSRRGVSPTAAGLVAVSHATRVLATLNEMQSALEDLRGTVAGRLRVTVNMLFGRTIMGPVIAGLRQQHPGLQVELLTTDDVIDLDEREIDLAIRTGQVGNGNGLVRRIGSLEGVLVASPSYLDAAGRPAGPDGLRALSYIQYREDPEESELAMVHNGGILAVPVTPAFSAQHPDLVLHAVQSGIGFAKAPRFFVEDKLVSGQWEDVLPGYVPAPKPIYLVVRNHLRDSPNVRAFRSALLAHMSEISGFSLSNDLAA